MPMRRAISREEFVHELLGDRFEHALSSYDTERRLSVLVDEFLPGSLIAGKAALDVGCGLGFFSERLVRRGAAVMACDIGTSLLQRTAARAGCETAVVDALNLSDRFGRNRFDIVVSSECIEHTPNPERALTEMIRVLRPGGYLSVSTPNVVWAPIVHLATAVRLRPFDGLENFSSWRSIRQTIHRAGATVLEERGLHLFPFQIPLRTLSRWCDRHVQALRGLMINICVLARKHS